MTNYSGPSYWSEVNFLCSLVNLGEFTDQDKMFAPSSPSDNSNGTPMTAMSLKINSGKIFLVCVKSDVGESNMLGCPGLTSAVNGVERGLAPDSAGLQLDSRWCVMFPREQMGTQDD